MSKLAQLTVYYGCMFSGKTSALIQHISNSNLKQNELVVIKPEIDVRYSKNQIKTHDGKAIDCLLYNRDFEAMDHVDQYTKMFCMDEAQFFDKTFAFQVNRLLNKGIHVVASGLDKDYLNRPFGLMSTLIEMADIKHHLKAKCEVCGGEAEYTYRKTENKVLILIGQSEHYEARCSNCLE